MVYVEIDIDVNIDIDIDTYIDININIHIDIDMAICCKYLIIIRITIKSINTKSQNHKSYLEVYPNTQIERSGD